MKQETSVKEPSETSTVYGNYQPVLNSKGQVTWYCRYIPNEFEVQTKKGKVVKLVPEEKQFQEAVLWLLSGTFLRFYLGSHQPIQCVDIEEESKTTNPQDKQSVEQPEIRFKLSSKPVPGFRSLKDADSLEQKNAQLPHLVHLLLIEWLGLANNCKLNEIGVNEQGNIVHIDPQLWSVLFSKHSRKQRKKLKFKTPDFTPQGIFFPKYYQPFDYLAYRTNGKNCSEQTSLNKFLEEMSEQDETKQQFLFGVLQIIAYPMELVLVAMRQKAGEQLDFHYSIQNNHLLTLNETLKKCSQHCSSIINKAYLTNPRKTLGLRAEMINALLGNQEIRQYILSDEALNKINDLIEHLVGENALYRHQLLKGYSKAEIGRMVRANIFAARQLVREKAYLKKGSHSFGAKLETCYQFNNKRSAIPTILASSKIDNNQPDALHRKYLQLEIDIQKQIARLRRWDSEDVAGIENYQKAFDNCCERLQFGEHADLSPQKKLWDLAYIHIQLVIEEQLRRINCGWLTLNKYISCRKLFTETKKDLEESETKSGWSNEQKAIHLAFIMLGAFRMERGSKRDYYHFPKSYLALAKCVDYYFGNDFQNHARSSYGLMLDTCHLYYQKPGRQPPWTYEHELLESVNKTYSFFNADAASNIQQPEQATVKKPKSVELFEWMPNDPQFHFSKMYLQKLVASLSKSNPTLAPQLLLIAYQQTQYVAAGSQFFQLLELTALADKSHSSASEEEVKMDASQQQLIGNILRTLFEMEDSNFRRLIHLKFTDKQFEHFADACNQTILRLLPNVQPSEDDQRNSITISALIKKMASVDHKLAKEVKCALEQKADNAHTPKLQ